MQVIDLQSSSTGVLSALRPIADEVAAESDRELLDGPTEKQMLLKLNRCRKTLEDNSF